MISPIINVEDVDASVAFYTTKLGFGHAFSLPGPDGKNAFAFVNLGSDVSLGLNQDGATEHRGSGVDFMIYLPDGTDIDQTFAEIKQRGVVIEADIDTHYWGDRTFSVRDPDGYRLTFAKTVKQVDMNEAAAIMRGDKVAE